jgi:signal transduction histidine kinase
LSESCAAISSGDLRSVSTRGATGEVLALEETFNNMVSSLRDKESMERKLRQAQRLSALGNLAAGVAHDVRNPLNAIKLLSSHALDNLPENDGGAGKHLQTIRREVDRLEGIVSSFMSLAKERELSPEPNKVDLLLAECAHLLQKDAESRGVTLVHDLRSGDTMLQLDAREWKRAIMNVLLNALEACPAGGRVRMFSRLTDVSCEIEVRDDGPGLNRVEIERVFEPYYTTKPGGTGLGLSITRGIIEEHGGTIEMTSSGGQGCQVLITLPLDKAGVR